MTLACTKQPGKEQKPSNEALGHGERRASPESSGSGGTLSEEGGWGE
jgi:hypothetical protein